MQIHNFLVGGVPFYAFDDGCWLEFRSAVATSVTFRLPASGVPRDPNTLSALVSAYYCGHGDGIAAADCADR